MYYECLFPACYPNCSNLCYEFIMVFFFSNVGGNELWGFVKNLHVLISKIIIDWFEQAAQFAYWIIFLQLPCKNGNLLQINKCCRCVSIEMKWMPSKTKTSFDNSPVHPATDVEGLLMSCNSVNIVWRLEPYFLITSRHTNIFWFIIDRVLVIVIIIIVTKLYVIIIIIVVFVIIFIVAIFVNLSWLNFWSFLLTKTLANFNAGQSQMLELLFIYF